LNRHEGMRPQSDFAWLLSKLAIVAASWKLVAIGTAILTAAGIAGTLLLTKPVYSSHMILPLTPTLRAIVQAGLIEGAAASELGSNLYSVSVSGPSPEETEATIKKALDQITARSKPTGTTRDRILKQINLLESAIREIGAVNQTFPAPDADLKLKLIELQTRFDGLSAEDVIMPPTKAVRADRLGLTKLGALLFGSFGLMAIFVISRKELRYLRPLR
jgi:hypothetical protein